MSRISLIRTNYIRHLGTPCLFQGKVEGDPLSKVFVSGCHNSRETLVSIASSQLPNGIVDLSLVDGITNIITSDDVQLRKGTMNQDYSAGGKISDYLFPRQTRFRAPYIKGPLPSQFILKTDIKYDNSLLKHFNNSHQKTKDWINKIVGLTQTRFYLESIIIKVTLKIGTVAHVDEELKADGKSLGNLYKKHLPDLTSYFCEDLGGSTPWGGFAYVKSACLRSGEAVNIVELFSKSDIWTAKVFAHELGHNIDML